MGKITDDCPGDDRSSLAFAKGGNISFVTSSSTHETEHTYTSSSAFRRVPQYGNSAFFSLQPNPNMESNLSTLDVTGDGVNQHEDSVSSTVHEFTQDTNTLTQDPNSMLLRMLNMSVTEEQSWLDTATAMSLRTCSPPGTPSSPSNRESRSSSPSPSRKGGVSPLALAVSEEATLGDTLLVQGSSGSPGGKDVAPDTGSRTAPDLQNLQMALRALIKGVTQASPQESRCASASTICGVAKTLLSADSTTHSTSNLFSPHPVSALSKGGAARRINQVVKRPTLYMSFPSRSRHGAVEVKILAQPEEQHRARYLTEGSRGAVKDRTGMGFPSVKLVGIQEQVKLQVFIGTDQGKVQPHMFYQASRVCGKNSTPCVERRVDGTTVLEIDMLPAKDMTVSCDCVGILKERNVDVEKRLVRYGGTRNKKRSTKCRLVFRVCLPSQLAPDGSTIPSEILQVASAPILCTQPPGIPEISKKSLTECSSKGEVELFIIGKNFLKDTQVLFKEPASDNVDHEVRYIWEKSVTPEKEYLQPTHLICRTPPFRNPDIAHPVLVHLVVTSGGRASEPHPFTYTPVKEPLDLKPQFGVPSGSTPTIIQIPVLTAASTGGAQQQQQRHSVPTLVIPTTTISLSTTPGATDTAQLTSNSNSQASSSNIQFVVVQQPAAAPQSLSSSSGPVNLMVSSQLPTALKAGSDDTQQSAESCNLKRKISCIPEELPAPEKCTSFETQGEDAIASGEASLAKLGIFYQEGNSAQATTSAQPLLPPNVPLRTQAVEQMIVQEIPSDHYSSSRHHGFESGSHWHSVPTMANSSSPTALSIQEAGTVSVSEAVWPTMGLTSCEPTSDETEAKTSATEGSVMDPAAVGQCGPFTDEQQFKKQKVKAGLGMSLPGWAPSTLEPVQSMDYMSVSTANNSQVKAEPSAWSTSVPMNELLNESVKPEPAAWSTRMPINGLLNSSESAKVPVVFGNNVIMDTAASGPTSTPVSEAHFVTPTTFTDTPQPAIETANKETGVSPVAVSTEANFAHTAYESRVEQQQTQTQLPSSMPAQLPPQLSPQLPPQLQPQLSSQLSSQLSPPAIQPHLSNPAPGEKQQQAQPQVSTAGQGSSATNLDHNISTMSMLPESELLRMINPNAFDNV
ncbi:nuclear factor of activated T-cells 5-like isoform X2 [Ornithodoros turicata]|uniref:nuclear factor of activated T-cells 5-like isoform X2 n=1 Tax=Ornithodoros turicata TaxID=34597 RepID=UPI00313923A0